MLDFTAMTLAIGPELWLAATGLIGVLLGALLKDKFNGLSFKFGALVLFAAAGIAAMTYQGGEAFNGLVETNTFVNCTSSPGSWSQLCGFHLYPKSCSFTFNPCGV